MGLIKTKTDGKDIGLNTDYIHHFEPDTDEDNKTTVYFAHGDVKWIVVEDTFYGFGAKFDSAMKK